MGKILVKLAMVLRYLAAWSKRGSACSNWCFNDLER